MQEDVSRIVGDACSETIRNHFWHHNHIYYNE